LILIFDSDLPQSGMVTEAGVETPGSVSMPLHGKFISDKDINKIR